MKKEAVSRTLLQQTHASYSNLFTEYTTQALCPRQEGCTNVPTSPLSTMQGSLDGEHWAILRNLLLTYK
jgi:hypothetical protein